MLWDLYPLKTSPTFPFSNVSFHLPSPPENIGVVLLKKTTSHLINRPAGALLKHHHFPLTF